MFAYCPLAIEKGQPRVLTLHRGASKRRMVKCSAQRKGRGVGRLPTVRRWFRTVAICLLFNFFVIFSSTNFRFLSIKTR
jgi:hypothetical protein